MVATKVTTTLQEDGPVMFSLLSVNSPAFNLSKKSGTSAKIAKKCERANRVLVTVL